jgi:hypothetical protein
MVMAQWDTMTTTMAMAVNVDDKDDEDDDTSLPTSNEGNNCNRDDGKEACALTTTTSVHWQRQQHSQL